VKVFLTGATGYVSSVVAEKLLEQEHEVVGLARNAYAGVTFGAIGGK